jgi:Family of unknown function (DUF5715)
VLWRSAPPKFLMRSNAFIPALLALAAVSFTSTSGLAKPTHTLAHKAPALAPATKHVPRHKAAVGTAKAGEGHGSSHHAVAKTAAPEPHPRTARVKASEQPHASRRHHLQQAAAAPADAPRPEEHEAALDAAPKKATSEDFLRAAAAAPEVPAPVAIHDTTRPDEPGEAKPVQRSAPPSKPVAVVSVIRPTAEKPQLKSVEEVASTPVILPSLYNKRGRLIVPPPLKGSHEILVHQNQVADHDGLDRIQNDDDLLDMRNRRFLVALPLGEGMAVDERLPANRRYCRPWTAQFLATLARAHYAHFHTPLQVNSAVRTVEFQQHLIHINGNAAPAEGDTASPHLTGQAVDIAKHGLSLTEIAWMRGYLLPLVQEGKIDVEEEFQQACFHISVYKKYLPPASNPERDEAHRTGSAALAAAIR